MSVPLFLFLFLGELTVVMMEGVIAFNIQDSVKQYFFLAAGDELSGVDSCSQPLLSTVVPCAQPFCLLPSSRH